jgi:hypothetical protein
VRINGHSARLLFDLRINQKFDLFVKVVRLEAKIVQDMQDHHYAFKIRLIDESHQDQVSAYSEPFENPTFASPIPSNSNKD